MYQKNSGNTLQLSYYHVLLRILVQSGIHDEFVDALRRSIEGLKQGGPFEDGVNVGPLIHEAAVSKVPNSCTSLKF